MNTGRDFIDVNGTRLYYEVAGSGQALVLVHGFSLDMRMWDDQFTPLAQRFRVIRYDMRGFGKSDLPTDGPYSHVDDLTALLDRLDVHSAHFVGLSKGGAVTLNFALTHPQRVQSLVLIDTVLDGFQWSPESSARDGLVWQRAREGGIPAAKESWLTHPLFAAAQRQPTVAARLAQIINDYSGWHFVNANPERGLEPPAAQRLRELNMPALVMVGEQDVPDCRQIADLVCQQLPRARELVVPGVGHMANMEAPDLVTEAMLAFLTEQGISGREKVELPCCGLVDTRRVKELPHVYGFDFDLFQCGQCARYWVYAWRTAGGWEEITAEDAEKMRTLGDDELRAFMKDWAQSFN